MTKKSALKEWFSRIVHGLENPHEFSIVFRDFNKYVVLPFNKFLLRQHEDSIPLHRISQIRKLGTPVYTRPNFCTKCGNPLVEGKCSDIYCH